MKKSIHDNISLEQQPQIVLFTQIPNNQEFSNNMLETTGDYEQYIYTGNKEQIDAKYQELVDSYSTDGTKRITLTRTRKEGYLWELSVKLEQLLAKAKEEEPDEPDTPSDPEDPDTPEEPEEEEEEEEITPAEEEFLEGKYGSAGKLRLQSVSVALQSQDIFFHDRYKDLDSRTLGAIRMYMNGSTETDIIPDPNDPSQTIILKDIIPGDNDLVKLALKYKTYNVPNITLTFTRFSKTRPAINTNIPTFSEGSINGITIPKGWQAMYSGGGASLTNEGKGYTITDTYTIGKFPTELYE